MQGDPRQFLGLERDGESGLDYVKARYYRPVWGRFTSVDPIISTAITNPQRWNRYAYALNNPLKYKDPSGLDAEFVDHGMDEGSSHIGFFGDNLDDFSEFYYNASTSYGEAAWKADGRRSVAAEEQAAQAEAKAAAEALHLNRQVVAWMNEAYTRVANGIAPYEVGFIVFRTATGYRAEWVIDNRNSELIFPKYPHAVAYFHTHPKGKETPRAGSRDSAAADKLGKPLYAMTEVGLWRYDPLVKDPIQVMPGLSWRQ